MQTSILSKTQFVSPGGRRFVLCGVPFDLRTYRGAARHLFEVSWFPCWLLNCSWDIRASGARALREMVGKSLGHPNEHYLPRLAAVDNPGGESAWAVLHK